MDTEQGKTPASIAPWKRLIIRAFAWGVGCGLAISLVLLSLHFYIQRPKNWDTHALRVRNVKAQSLENLKFEQNKLVTTSVGTTFNVDLENTTGADITLPQTVLVTQATKLTGALLGSSLKLAKDFFIPAHHVVTIWIENSELCAAEVHGKVCFDRYFQEYSEIILFDEKAKFEIRIPIPAFTITGEKARRYRSWVRPKTARQGKKGI
jgi:hypothetical protein